jgi:hypothetical protein
MNLAPPPCFAFSAATPHWRDSGGYSSVISRTLSLGIAQDEKEDARGTDSHSECWLL